MHNGDGQRWPLRSYLLPNTALKHSIGTLGGSLGAFSSFGVRSVRSVHLHQPNRNDGGTRHPATDCTELGFGFNLSYLTSKLLPESRLPQLDFPSLPRDNEAHSRPTFEHLGTCEAVMYFRKTWWNPAVAHLDDRTIDYAVKIRVNPDQKGVDLNVKHSMASYYPSTWVTYSLRCLVESF